MRYPLVPLVNELTFPLLFFWFCLPFVMLLIVVIIWLQLLLNEGKFGSGSDKVLLHKVNCIFKALCWLFLGWCLLSQKGTRGLLMLVVADRKTKQIVMLFC